MGCCLSARFRQGRLLGVSKMSFISGNLVRLVFKKQKQSWHENVLVEIQKWKRQMKYCKWTYQDIDGFYETSCCGGEGFQFNEGGVKENKFVYCPYCGKKIKEIKL